VHRIRFVAIVKKETVELPIDRGRVFLREKLNSSITEIVSAPSNLVRDTN